MSAHPAFFDAVTPASAQQIQGILSAVRRYLSMDVGFISEFSRGERIFRFTDADIANPVIPGVAHPLSESLCHAMCNGHLPPILKDLGENSLAQTMRDQSGLQIGAILGVPIARENGDTFGSLCCFSFQPDDSLTEQHLSILKMCADVVTIVLEQEQRAADEIAARRVRIGDLIEKQAIEMVFQPLYRAEDLRLTGFEALSRFPSDPTRSIEAWFAEAGDVGLGAELEFLAVRKALAALPVLPEPLKITVNLSPDSILDSAFPAVFEGQPVDRIVVEMTEHAVVADYDRLRQAMASFRERGLRLAIDDVGAGRSTFRHILDLNPEFIKLDRTLIRGIDADTARRALAEALTLYGRRIGCEVVAEGVETEDELAVIRALGITRVQGYLVGRPMGLQQALALSGIRTTL